MFLGNIFNLNNSGIYNDLVKWKNSSYRKPLILNGARQTGKTWILNEFGKKEYKNVVYINCDNNNEMKEMFYDFDVNRLILSFSALTNTRIEKENTLIILDEIQEFPLGLTALNFKKKSLNIILLWQEAY